MEKAIKTLGNDYYYSYTFLWFFFAKIILVVGIIAIGTNKFTDRLYPLVVGVLIVSIGLSLVL
ncbi:hypothetical protein [Neobacillus drentensis]|uniref:hypothetical protein n=1 Tax=Neobacillus drentensis TaxID=220684 RepID=UPI003B587F51